MNTNEIKKQLYKQKPIASIDYIKNGIVYYITFLDSVSEVITFEVPVDDMGETRFTAAVEAYLLIRWIKEN